MSIAKASYKYMTPNMRNNTAPPKVTATYSISNEKRVSKDTRNAPCLTDIFVDTYLPPITANAVHIE